MDHSPVTHSVLMCFAAAAITGTRTRKAEAAAVPPVGWSTAELVGTCVQPALGATRLSYVQVSVF